MIKRIYIDGYRCFSNFEFKPARMNLILGVNGSGKTSLFDVVSHLMDLVVGGTTASEAFATQTLTAWGRVSKNTAFG